MAKEALLESAIAAGKILIEELDKNDQTIDAGLWFYYPDLDQWKLLLSSKKFDATNLTKSYTKISEILYKTDRVSQSISISDIKLLSQTDPMMKLLKKIARTEKNLNEIRMMSSVFNGIYVEDMLIYRNIR
ncbi:MAG TPA: hypothetical protein VHY35_07395 [Stellaceae bacterium]|jgi:hypothetical protein|nr:hypothetical protein [Stellaceae bacterium]